MPKADCFGESYSVRVFGVLLETQLVLGCLLQAIINWKITAFGIKMEPNCAAN